jgi:hypothetical protein
MKFALTLQPIITKLSPKVFPVGKDQSPLAFFRIVYEAIPIV